MKANRTFGLIGYPLSHSFSKKYFSEKFDKENIANCEYNLFAIDTIAQFPQLIKDYPNLCGLNVTIPYKESVIPFLDELDETAKAVGAVNCIKIIKSDSQISNPKSQILVGYNTDVFGFRQSIKPFLEIQHERALILGTGGASKAVAHVLKEIGIDSYFVTRSKENKTFSNLFTYDELNDYVINAFKLIVNTTPLGMYPNVQEAPALPYESLQSDHLLYDLVYNPPETEFLKRGKAQGASVVNGLSMLHQQAEEAWRIWNTAL
ncbi:MAG: shikimate dehydrogenase [Bacteroidota bacterium]